MALEVSMTGTGTIGNIAPGWSLNESATSVTIGERTAGTGSVSFTAQATDDSLLVINNDTVSTIGNLGTVHGVVQSVSQSGLTASITHGTVADKLNLDVDVQPVPEGGPKAWCSALEYAIGIGPNPYNAPVSYVPEFANNGTSFGFFGSTISDNYIYPLSQFLNYANGYPATPTYNIGNGSMDSTQGVGNTTGWTTLTETQLIAINTAPDWFQMQENATILHIARTVIQFSMSPDSATRVSFGLVTDLPESTIITVDGNAQTLSSTGGSSVSYSTLDASKPLMFSLVMSRSTSGTDRILVSGSVTDHTNTKVNVSLGGLNLEGNNIYLPYHRIECNDFKFISFYTTPASKTAPAITDYIEPADFSGTIAPTLFDFTGYTGTSFSAYPATSGVAWELLQDLAAAENFEVAINGDTVYIRDIGSQTLDITNRTVPNVNPTSTLSGKQINIAYSNAEFVNGTVYDAAQDGNNIITVEAGATTVTSVKWNVSPLVVNSPTRSDTWPVEVGQYYVIDSEGLPLLAEEWEAYGAYVTATIDPDDSSAIQITVKGPSTDTTLAGGPYKLAASDSGVEYGALKLAGTGVYAGDNQLGLLTAVDPDKYTRATVNTISNPFVVTEENAYDRGVWASMVASGPTVSVSFSVPLSAVAGVGLTPGSLFDYNQSTYRVASSSLGSLNVNINAERYVLVSDVDAIWGSQTVADFDAVWGALECQDQIIFPYKVA